ncbi:amidohydrolase [Stieleria sp. JC731]|uniref:M20 metallopeptidase family protein n=1 Tax=Pirellulaceae TaxID=2691357 RepID=UPI001E44F80E|nr:amidohydrolase [Stieleria sp. JC731]MCC9601280.1 amidohydrolase [Stieleria sp. JC731]
MNDNSAMTLTTAIDKIAEEHYDDWISLRRHLHQHPELSGEETWTSNELKSRLCALDLPVRMAGESRGVMADLITDVSLADEPRLAIRGDIDGLPIQDEKSVPYRSCKPGVMHACGHDVHATVVVAAMQILKELERTGQLPWPVAVRAVLQPAEENSEGARHMIHHRALKDVEAIIALHVDPTRQVGCIGIRNDVLTAACDQFEITIEGKGGHGARPHLAIDPIEALVAWVEAAYRRVNRAIDPHQTVVISIGMIKAGHSANVIPDTAVAMGTLRTLSPSSRRKAFETIESINESIETQFGCTVKLRLGTSAPAVVNDRKIVALMYDAIVQTLNPAAVDWIESPSMGSEDFSYYLEHVPGAMFRLGVAGSQVGTAPLHTPTFDIDERAIAHAAKLFASIAIRYFDPARK